MEKYIYIAKEANLFIFRFFNNLFYQPTFENTKIIINNIADPHLVFYHIMFICCIAISLLYYKRQQKNEFKELLIKGISSTTTAALSLSLGMLAVDLIKNYTSSLRPYCSLENVYALEQTLTTTCYRSFPSGHTAFSIIMIISFWPLLNKFFRYIALIFFSLLLISRMASGAHFPVDLLGSITICLPITLYIKTQTNKIVRKHIGKYKIFKKLCS